MARTLADFVEAALESIEEIAITAGDDVAFAVMVMRCGPPDATFQFRLTIGLRKVGGEWRITDTVMLRGGVSRAVRAPNLNELFEPQSKGLWAGTDGCAGPHALRRRSCFRRVHWRRCRCWMRPRSPTPR